MDGATIIVKGTAKGTKSDANGNFSINAEGSATLVVSFIGFETKEVKVGGQATISVQLMPYATTDEQIVVVGLWYAKEEPCNGRYIFY